ncbi:hypothetical protein FQR65_LT15143 [Abscondita terminalis]|nr:hypothetical protein FQR65_LT15143 [Abscondita terminalis]
MKTKKIRLLALGVCLGLFLFDTPLLFAVEKPRALAPDHRIRVVNYQSDNVVLMNATTFTAMQIVFGNDEVIENIQGGDLSAWTLNIPKDLGYMMFLKPTIADSNTNMTVITNKHTYYFHLISHSNETPTDTYALRFIYPKEEQANLSGHNNPTQKQAILNANDQSQNYNWDYSFSGSRSIMPLHIFDDGQFTYLQLQPRQVVPAIFAVDNRSGKEALVNYRREGDYLIVQQLSPQFTLRADRHHIASVFNNKQPELDVVQTAAKWSKVSKKKFKDYSYIGLGVVGIVVFLFFMLPDKHPKTETPSSDNSINNDYHNSLNENLMRLKAMHAEKPAVPFSEPINQPFNDPTKSEVYSARQNAPTTMYPKTEATNKEAESHGQDAALTGQGSNESFANTSSKTETVEANTIAHPDYTVASGELLPAVLETAINSDLLGMVRAVISQSTYSYTGERVLIPSGSRLIGQYSSAVTLGQNRVMVIWNRIILPNGIAIQLDSPSTDVLGRAGQGADSVNTHFFTRFGESALLSLIGAGTSTVGVNNQDQNNSTAQYRAAIAQSFQQSAQQSLQGSVATKPTLQVHQGTAIHVFVAKDLKINMGCYAPDSIGLLAPIQAWLEDSEISEILMNQPGEIYVEKYGKLQKYNVPEFDQRSVMRLFQLIANENAQEISEKKPLLSASLQDGSRLQIVLPPTAKYHTLSIRRKIVRNFSLEDYEKIQFYKHAVAFDIKADHFSQLGDEKQLVRLYQKKNWADFVKCAIELKKNIVISGGTSSGKTTFLNACLRHIPLSERIILLEDAREIDIPHPNQVSLLSSKGDQALARVSMQDLVQCCLRLRPDRIIVGEVRGREILDFLSASSTGHEGSFTSIHANNPRIAFMRMTQLYKQNNVPSMSDQDILREINEVVDIIIQVGKGIHGRHIQSVYYKYGQVGGIKRAIAQQMLFYWVSFLILSVLGLTFFIHWEEINLQPYPWFIISLLLRLPAKTENHLILCLLASYSLLFMVLIWKCFSIKTKAEKIFGNAHFANAFEIQKAGLYAEQGLILGKVYGKTLRLPGFEGALVVAPTGSGKTTAIAIPNLLEWTGSGVFNDLKGELYRLTGVYRKNNLHNACFLWAPADIHKTTSCYNPFFYVSDHPDLRIRDLQLIAETLIPATKLGDGFWYQSSREIFLTISLYLLESTGTATLSDIHDLSKQESFFAWLANEIMDHEEFSKPLKQNAFALLGADEKTQKNILKDFHSRMGLFNDPLVEHEPQADEPYGVLALMDEFGNMARINKLKDGLSFLRSYRMRCIIIVQYLAQIYSVYGRYDAKGFLNSKVKITFALNDREDTKFFSESLGNKTTKVSSSSVNTSHGDHPGSRSENINFQSRPLMTSDEIMQLSDKKAIILMEARNPIKADKCYWFKDPNYRHLLRTEID